MRSGSRALSMGNQPGSRVSAAGACARLEFQNAAEPFPQEAPLRSAAPLAISPGGRRYFFSKPTRGRRTARLNVGAAALGPGRDRVHAGRGIRAGRAPILSRLVHRQDRRCGDCSERGEIDAPRQQDRERPAARQSGQKQAGSDMRSLASPPRHRRRAVLREALLHADRRPSLLRRLYLRRARDRVEIESEGEDRSTTEEGTIDDR